MSHRKPIGRSVFKRNDGGYVLTYQAEPNAPWRQKRLGFFASDAEAQKAAGAWLAKAKADGELPSLTKRVEEWAAAWLLMRARQPNLSGSTVSDNKSHLEQHILPRFGRVPLGKLDALEIRVWVRELRESVRPSTLRNIINTFSAMYEDARSERWVVSPSNVVRDPSVRKEMPSVVTNEVITLQLATAQQLLTDARVPEHRRVRYAIGFLTALRDGEIAGLTWGDIELDAEMPVLHVRRAMAFKAEKGKHAALDDPKTSGSRRTVPLHQTVAAALRHWRDVGCLRWLDAPRTAATPLFPSPRTGGHWRPRSAEELRADLETLGHATVTPNGTAVDFHATRRSLSTWLGDLGVEESMRQTVLGHAAKTTIGRHYTAPLLRRMAEALALVPLRWQVDQPPPSDRVRPHDAASDPHSAAVMRPHNEATKTASAPVAQWIEQRFPKSLLVATETAEVASENVASDGGAAQHSGLPSAVVRSEQRAQSLHTVKEPFLERMQRTRAEADAIVAGVVDGVIAGGMTIDAVTDALFDAQSMLRLRELRGDVSAASRVIDTNDAFLERLGEL